MTRPLDSVLILSKKLPLIPNLPPYYQFKKRPKCCANRKICPMIIRFNDFSEIVLHIYTLSFCFILAL